MERKVKKTDKLVQALKKITYGFYIVSSRKPAEQMSTRETDYMAAATVNWISQGSFDPPLVTAGIRKHTHLHETIEKSRIFAVNILGKNQQDMLSPFAKENVVEGNKINGYPFKDGEATGAPIFDGVPAYFECKVVEEISIGDHSIFVGEVLGGDTRDEKAVPLFEWETNLHYGG